MTILGTSGNDDLAGTGGSDVFNMSQGGNDKVDGGAAKDQFNFGGAFDAGDQVIGGGGNDTLALNGDYWGPKQLYLGPSTLVSVEQIKLVAGHSYSLNLTDPNVASGHTLTLDASALGAADILYAYSQFETDGNIKVIGGTGGDTIYLGGVSSIANAGDGNDTIYGVANGHESINGGNGDDSISLQSSATVSVKGGDGNDSIAPQTLLNAGDRIDGGNGFDEVGLAAGYENGFKFRASTITNVESLFLDHNHSFRLVINDGNVAAGAHMIINGDLVQNGNTVVVNASSETDGSLFIGGGTGNDTLVGGQGGNTISGGGGQDKLTAGTGDDVFLYFSGAADSTGTSYDVIKGFDASHDSFDLTGAVGAVDAAITSGALHASHFDADLAAIVDGAHLSAGHAVLFTASAGSLAGHTFLVVDANGMAGYQTGADYVMELAAAQNLGNLHASNFI